MKFVRNWGRLGMKYKLSEVIELIGGGTPKTSKSEYWNGDIPWLSVKDFNNDNRYVYQTEKSITQLGLENSSTKLLKNGDIIISARGTVGEIATIPFPMAFNQSCYGLRAKKNVVTEDFLYYLIKHNVFVLKKHTHGSVFDTITRDTFENIEVDIPDLDVQDKIASILSDLDGKIELNNKINNNLEQQCQTVFGEWLQSNGNDADEVSLGDVCLKVTDGSHFSPKDVPDSSIPMLSVKDMGEFDFILTSCKHISEEDYQKMVTNDCVPQLNDILVAKDGSYLKEIFICNEQRKLAILSSIAIFRPNTKIIHPEILLAFLKSPRVLQEVRDNYVSGSALPRIVLKDFKKLTFKLPNMSSQDKIAPLLVAIREQIAIKVAENQQLTQLRDALLPKLMSGELDVSDIDL